MDGGEEDQRVAPRLEVASLPVPDELVAEVLLRLPTPADLVRASAACVSFRRAAAHRSFLRRYRKLHAPPLLGFLERPTAFYPAIAPHPSASAAGVVAWAADFSSFLPAPASHWSVQDIRDGRVVLVRCSSSAVVFPEAVVCDPLHRRYLLLPPLAYDLAALLSVEIFLVPPGCGVEAATEDETSFTAIWMAQFKTRQAVPSRDWTHLSAGLPPSTATSLFYLRRQYVYGCF